MGIQYNYVAGYTHILSGDVTLSEVNYENFTSEMLNDLIKTILTLEGYNEEISKKTTGDTRVGNLYIIKWNDDSTCAKLYKIITTPGYIYNTKKETLIYSFFFTKVYNDGYFPSLIIPDDESEVEEVHQEIVVQPSPKILNFVDELKKRLEQRKSDTFVENHVDTVSPSKPEFLLELEQEINLRQIRAKKRDRKIARKKQKRLSKL